MRTARYFFSVAIACTMLAGCIPPEPALTPAPSPAPAPTPSETSAPAPTSAPASIIPLENWMDAPQTPGDWSWRSTQPNISQAQFGLPGAEPVFIVECNKATDQIALIMQRVTNGPLQVRTETLDRTIQMQLAVETQANLYYPLDPRDPVLDAMALSKGRFALLVSGAEPLFIPAWPEFSRVVEDCRD